MQRIENPLQVSPATDKASKKFSQMPTCKRGLDRRRRMSRFRPRCCIMKYETIPFREKETPGYSGGNHPGRPGNFHPNTCANHYHL